MFRTRRDISTLVHTINIAVGTVAFGIHLKYFGSGPASTLSALLIAGLLIYGPTLLSIALNIRVYTLVNGFFYFTLFLFMLNDFQHNDEIATVMAYGVYLIISAAALVVTVIFVALKAR